MKVLIFVLCSITAWGAITGVSVGVTNTQAVVGYSSSYTGACTFVVSASPSLSPVVIDLNTTLYPGSNSDGLSGTGNRQFVVGKRTTPSVASDSNIYSRALQTFTPYYGQITCGADTANFSFATKNISLGSTFNEVPPFNTTGNAVVPTLPQDRTTVAIDNQTGVAIKRLYLNTDSTNMPYNDSSGRKAMCGYQMVGPGPGYLCSYPATNGGTALTYYIIPSTGETRYLGHISIPFTGVYPLGGGSGVANPNIDPSDATLLYWALQDVTGHQILLKLQYMGNYLNQSSDVAANYTITNLTPTPNTINSLIDVYNSSYPGGITETDTVTGGSCSSNVVTLTVNNHFINGQTVNVAGIVTTSSNWNGVVQVNPTPTTLSYGQTCSGSYTSGGTIDNIEGLRCSPGTGGAYTMLTCAGQDGPGWVAILYMGDKQPIGMCTDCMHVVGAFDFTANPTSRWCGVHSPDIVANQPVVQISPHGITTSPYGPYVTTLVGNITSGTTSITLAGQPMYNGQTLQNLAINDTVIIGSETILLTGGSSPTWTVTRGYGTSASSHSNGDTVQANCQSNPGFGAWQDLWWTFLTDPNATGSGYFEDNYLTGGHEDVSSNGRAAESGGQPGCNSGGEYCGMWGPILNIINVPVQWILSMYSSYSGATSNFGGNTYTHYPSYQQRNAPPVEQFWYFDEPNFSGDSGQMGPGATHISGDLYKYVYGTNGPMQRKFFNTLVASGGRGLVDVSGPSSSIGDTSGDNFKYCVAYVAGECQGGSSANDAFINAPSLTSQACLGSERASDFDLCMQDLPMGGQGVFQYGTPMGFNEYSNSRKLTWGFGEYKSSRIVKPTPAGEFMFLNSPDGTSAPPFSYIGQIPPTPPIDTINRSQFIQLPLQLSVPVGLSITNAVVDFGYLENGVTTSYYCTSRAEKCIAGTTVSPFAYPIDGSGQVETGLTGTTCSTSCTVNVPAISGRILFYQVRFRNSSNVTVSTGAQKIVVVP